MRQLRPGNPVTILQLSVIGILLAVLAMEILVSALLHRPSPRDDVIDETPLPVVAPDTATESEPAELADILERPIFFPDRVLPAEPEKPAATQPQQLRLRLEGLAITSGARVALLRNSVDNKLLRLSEGDAFESWTLESIQNDRAVFRRGPESKELLLDPGKLETTR